jgi:cobalt/nickel transport system permease protein
MRTRFLDKTLLALAEITEQSLFSEAYARRPGLLQSLDVRVKLISFLFLLVVVSLALAPQTLWALYGLTLLLAALSRVPLRYFLKRVWLFVPIFSAAIVLPAMLNVVTPGEPLLVLCRLDHPYTWGPYTVPAEIAVTRQGLWGAVVFVSRVAASVSFAVLLTLTTRWSDIFSGLRALFVPRAFVMVLSMTERYVFLFSRMVQDMYRARKSRTIGRFASAEDRGWVASRIGVTFKKSLEMSGDIHRAMLSRGYLGEAVPYGPSRPALRDFLWLVIIAAAGVIMLVFERRMLP